jgi:hypothetical protein
MMHSRLTKQEWRKAPSTYRPHRLSDLRFKALRVVEESLIPREALMADTSGVIKSAASRARFRTGDCKPRSAGAEVRLQIRERQEQLF